MRYSLLSRFRGSLLGTALGEVYQSPFQLSTTPICSKKSDFWLQVAIRGSQSLIDCGRLDLEDWKHRGNKLQQSEPTSKIGFASLSNAAIATLPVALFFHEDQLTLKAQLQQAAKLWLPAGQTPTGVLAMGYAIAQALTERLNPDTLIPQTLVYLEEYCQDAKPSLRAFIQQLEQVQNLLEQKAGLEKTVTQICRHPFTDTIPIALAFYCFLSTTEDFHLALARAVRTGYQPQTTAALTGALSGAYNSLAGIPIVRRLTATEMVSLADRLLAVWSGVHITATDDRVQWSAVAAPRVMQQR